MTSILFSVIWLLLTDSQPTIRKPIQIEQGAIGVWTGPKILDYSYLTTKEGLTGNSVRTMLQDRNGDIWIATNAGITRQNKQGWYSYTIANGLPDNEVLTLHMDKTGQIWAGTRKGLAMFEKDSFKTLPMYRAPRNEKDLPVQTPVHMIYEDNSGQLWFGTDGFGLFKFNGKTLEHVIKPGC